MTIADLLKQINNLTAEQKQQLITALKQPTNMPNRYENGYVCPHCGKIHIRKHGTKQGKQRYICMDCGKTFTEYNNTVFFSTKKTLNLWLEYIELMMTGLSLAKIADKLNISVPTAFQWRHKILKTIKNFQSDTIIGGIVEADETFMLNSHKGKHIEGVKGRTRGGVANYRGLSHEQVGVLVAIDRNKNVISDIYGRGRIKTKEVETILSNKITENSLMITDSCSAYRKFAENHNLKLKQIPSGQHSLGKYNINRINSYHSGLKKFIKGFNGISTRYLDNYLNWFKWIKSGMDNNLLVKDCLLGL